MKQLILIPALSFLILGNVEAKFEHPEPNFNANTLQHFEKRYNIAERGAVNDGQTINTKIIQSAIDECTQNGGGTVVVPKGVFKTGSLFLKPGVNLELQEGAVLKGSTDIND